MRRAFRNLAASAVFNGGSRRAPRQGFTLFEMMLVLAILAIFTMIAWPSLARSMDDYRLKRAAQQLRTELADARDRAVDTGMLYQFLYEPGGRRFVSIPAERDGSPPPLGGARSLTIASDDLPRHAGTLPEGFVFAASYGAFSEQKVQPELFAGLADAADLSGLSWSAPLLFREDGSTDDAEIPITDVKKSKSIVLDVRGFTGAASVGSVTEQETGL